VFLIKKEKKSKHTRKSVFGAFLESKKVAFWGEKTPKKSYIIKELFQA